MARFLLFKQAYKLGEDIVGMFDFDVGTVPCVQVNEAFDGGKYFLQILFYMIISFCIIGFWRNRSF